jgi:hypothetical protein
VSARARHDPRISAFDPQQTLVWTWVWPGLASLFLLDVAGLNFTSLPYPAMPICVVAPQQGKARPMLDLGLLMSGLAFFALSIGYAFACDRL